MFYHRDDFKALKFPIRIQRPVLFKQFPISRFQLAFGQFKIKQNTVVLYRFSASPWQTILNAEQHFLNKVTLSLLAGSYDVADIALHHNALNDIPFFGNLLML